MAENKNQKREEGLRRVRELAQNAMLGSGKTVELDIDYESEVGTKYAGVVIFKKPNTGDMMKMAGIKTAYIQRQFINEEGEPIPVDPILIEPLLLSLAEVISTLKVVITKTSDTLSELLNPEEIDEMDLLFHVYGRYQTWRSSFRKGNPDESKQADRGPGSENDSVAGEAL